jgi:hypothetical protein
MKNAIAIYREARALVRQLGFVTTVIGLSGGLADVYVDWCTEYVRSKRDRKQG